MVDSVLERVPLSGAGTRDCGAENLELTGRQAGDRRWWIGADLALQILEGVWHPGATLTDGVAQGWTIGLGPGATQPTTIRVLPSGSRSQNIGGTGSPMRLTSASTSTPSAFSWAW